MKDDLPHSRPFDLSQGKCPLCNRDSSRLFPRHGYWLRTCQTCQHQFTEIAISPHHVHQIYGDRYFSGGEAGYPDYLAEAAILRKHGQRYAQILSSYVPTGTMLDIGAAAGFILQGFIDRGWQGKGLEPNPQMAEYADLQQALHAASVQTKPGGFWLIETSNRHSLTARLLGQNWHMYSQPSVLHWFSPAELCQLGAKFGFVEVARGRPSKWIIGAHAKSVLHYKLKDSPWEKFLAPILALIPDRISIAYPAEDLF